MSGSQPLLPQTSTVAPLVPPPRPPRLRPPSRSSSIFTDPSGSNQTPNSGIWPEGTLATLLNQSQDNFLPATYKDHIRGSFMNMDKEPTEASSPAREQSSPTLGAGDGASPAPDGDHSKKSGSTYSNRSISDAPLSHPAANRSTMRSVFLVLSCAGAMIINVSGSCVRGVLSARWLIWTGCRLLMLLLFLLPFQPSEKIWGLGRINYSGSSHHIPSQRCVLPSAL